MTRIRKPIPDDYERTEFGFETSTTVWHLDDKEVYKTDRLWKGVTGEDGKSGNRANAGWHDSDYYSGSYAVFSAWLTEKLLQRYAGKDTKTILDPCAGGPVRGLVAAHMEYEYHGFDVRQDQIDYDREVLAEKGLKAHYHLGDARKLTSDNDPCDIDAFDFAFTSPPYHNFEKYSDQPDDLSNVPTYADFDLDMLQVATAMRQRLKPGAFACMLVGNFRDEETSELIDFPGDTVRNFRTAGFFHLQDIIIKTVDGTAALRARKMWKGKKLVPVHQHLLVFRVPKETKRRDKSLKRKSRAGKGR